MGKDSTTKFIGLDVHSKTISVAIAMKEEREKSGIMERLKTLLKP